MFDFSLIDMQTLTGQEGRMDEKQATILSAAFVMFARYGYSKTTMSDIASEAGVARQTVYNAFASKEDVLRAVVRASGERALAEFAEFLEGAPLLEEKFEAFQRLVPVAWYEAMTKTPDWAELMDGMNKEAANEIAAIETRWRDEIAAMIDAAPDVTLSDPAEIAEAAEFFYTASKNAKYGAQDMDSLMRRLATIRKAALLLLRG